MPRRVCLGVPPTGDCPTRSLAPEGASRCDNCNAATKRRQEANRPTRDKSRYKGSWPAYARAAIAAYRAEHGDVCPGWEREPHPIRPTDWVCDHDDGPYCRGCNGRKAATHDRARAKQQRARRVG